jgi:predicted metal-dependent phosphoesterase TrpH
VTASESFRVDPHVKVLSADVVARAKRRGLDAIVYAPHFTPVDEIRERAAAFSDDELLVVPGREVFTGDWRTRRHVLALGLTEPVPDFITLEGAMAELDRQDATVLAPHPGFLNVSFGRPELERYADQIDAIEAYNPKLLGPWADRARGFVDASDAPPFGSSYAHLPGSVGEVWTTFEEALEHPAEVEAAFAEGGVRTVGRRDGLAHRLRKTAEFAHLGYENTWQKLDRLFLQGTEPTHPGHLRYDGQFDDVAVY